MTIRDDFMGRVVAACNDRLVGVDRAIMDALKDGEDADLAALRADRRRLRDLPASIGGEALEDLLPQWPEDFPPLPTWFVDPGSVGELGAPCVVVCEPLSAEGEGEGGDGEGAATPPDLETVRAEREGFARADHARGVAALDLIVQTSKDPNAATALAPAYVQLQADLVARLARISAAETVEELREL